MLDLITITQEEYKKLITNNVKFELIREYLANIDRDKYLDGKMLRFISGSDEIARPNIDLAADEL